MQQFPAMVAIFLLSAVFVTTLQSQEKHLKKSELPAAVQKTADQQSVGAMVRGYSSETEDGKLQYEVSLTVDGHTKDVSIAPDGTINEVEEQVFLEKLPDGVRDALLKKAAGGKIIRVESLSKHGKLVAYEAQVSSAGKNFEIQVGPDGASLAHPE
jgi:Tfp pilus tip-associated adhesin PilY1